MNKQELLDSLDDILMSPNTIKLHVDRVAELRKSLDLHLTDDERQLVTDKIKARVQREARFYWNQNGRRGAILMATGVGKTKVAIDIVKDLCREILSPNILVSVPTQKLKDVGWKNEFDKWEMTTAWENAVTKTCYASLNKPKKHSVWDLVILDEGHNITENNSEFFKDNEVHSIVWLSGTKPRDETKIAILKQLGINPVYEITLDEAVKLGLVAPYKITIVTTELDETERYVKAGTIEKPFFNTELQHYNWLSKAIFVRPSKFLSLRRMRFIYDLKSKTRAIKWLLDNMISKDARTLIFCGSKKQAAQVCEHHYFSKPSKPPMPVKLRGSFDVASGEWDNAVVAKLKEYKVYIRKMTEYEEAMKIYQGDASYNLMMSGDISWMSCCEALNEGHNIPNMDGSVVGQLNSNELDLWQRIGRNIRWRPGHEADIWIVCCKNTQDEVWVNKAIANLDPSKITWTSLKELQSNFITLNSILNQNQDGRDTFNPPQQPGDTYNV